MAGYDMKEMIEPLPDDRRVVIRSGKTVEYPVYGVNAWKIENNGKTILKG